MWIDQIFSILRGENVIFWSNVLNFMILSQLSQKPVKLQRSASACRIPQSMLDKIVLMQNYNKMKLESTI